MVEKQTQQIAERLETQSSMCWAVGTGNTGGSLDSDGAHRAARGARASAGSRITVFGDYNPAAGNHVKFAEPEENRKTLRRGKKQGDKSKPALHMGSIEF